MIRSVKSTSASLYRASSTEGVLVMLAVMGALTATTMVVAPRYLEATPMVPPTATALSPLHRDQLETLTRLIGDSVGVVAIHDRGRSPFAEVVLWLTDEVNRGQLDDREFAVLSHSRVMHTVSLYRVPADAKGSIQMPDQSLVREPVFCDRWRANGLVRPLILMSGVSDMEVEQMPDQARLRLTLTWSGDSTDAADKASAVVGASRTPGHEQGGAG